MANERDYRLGSPSYDQDYDFVESYVRWYKGAASEDEIKSLQSGYISSLYKYKDKLGRFLDNLTVNELMEFGSNLCDKKSDNICRDTMNKYKNDIFLIVDEGISEIEQEFSIEEIQRIFLVISNGFCLSNEITKSPESETNKPGTKYIKYGPNYCYLPNDTGLFGFNTWLYSALNGIDLVGVPSKRWILYDFIGGCPTTFVIHDYFHSSKLYTHHGKTVEPLSTSRFLLGASIYKQIHLDTEATFLQKELLICALWIYLHEAHIRFEYTFTENYSSFTKNVDLVDEFERFRDLIITKNLIDAYYTHFEKEIKSLEEVNKELSLKRTGSREWWRYLSFYFREYCLKYYDTSIPKISVSEILNS